MRLRDRLRSRLPTGKPNDLCINSINFTDSFDCNKPTDRRRAPGASGMTRVLMVKLDQEDVIAKCAAQKVGISAIERLPAGGVRLVCKSGDGAALMTRKLKSHLISGPVVRQAHRPANSSS